MYKQTKQSGFAHLGIVVVSVVLLGLLGFAFYRNFYINKDVDANNTTEPKKRAPVKVDPANGWARYSNTIFNQQISFKYPTDWVVPRDGSELVHRLDGNDNTIYSVDFCPNSEASTPDCFMTMNVTKTADTGVESLAELRSNVTNPLHSDIPDVADITIGGHPALKTSYSDSRSSISGLKAEYHVIINGLWFSFLVKSDSEADRIQTLINTFQFKL